MRNALSTSTRKLKQRLKVGDALSSSYSRIAEGQGAAAAAAAAAASGAAAPRPIEKILIANRGEIACRVIRTARSLGIKTVAVYSDADKNALHVRSADEAVHIGPASAQRSYLSTNAILDALRRTKADAVHPGYGFLSENSEFAEACTKAGVKFIGPSAAAISLMGNKSASKKLMTAANVPVVPGYHGDDQSSELLQSEANRIGYPVLIKPVLGGGGKGMRIVNSENEFLDHLKSAIRESQTAFGDTRVLIEKYISQPRHIEVQIFGDQFGNHVYLFERDCSVQRRHQKIIEEAPAPLMTEEFRRSIGEAAVNAAKAVNYENAGTVEFIVDTTTGDFYFMEMNTRLQVEHPVTEMVTRQDLVEWQIRVASGEKVPCQQNELSLSGHSFEARVYAENVPRGFLPAAGTLHHFSPPAPTSTVRIETGVEESDTVSVHYDPMIAKLVVWGTNRDLALTKLSSCLSKFQIGGVPTNIQFLKGLAKHPAFKRGDVETHFIDHFKEDLLPSKSCPEQEIKVFAALAGVGICMRERFFASQGSSSSSPWQSCSGYRLNHHYTRKLCLQCEDGSPLETVAIEISYREANTFSVKVPGESSPIKFTTLQPDTSRDAVMYMDGDPSKVSFGYYKQDSSYNIHVWKGDAHHHFSMPLLEFSSPVLLENQHEAKLSSKKAPGSVTAPMAGLVVKVFVETGKIVTQGDPLLVLEAMKMEHIVRAPVSGLVTECNVAVAQQVSDGELLLRIKADSKSQ